MNTMFPVGFMLVPTGAALIVFASGGMVLGVSTKDSILSLFLASAPCLAAFFGFVTGRAANAFSAAPLRSSWRALFIAVLGTACATVSLPVGMLLLHQFQERGVWQTITFALWFAVVGMFFGYFYGPAFRRLARTFPRLKERDAALASDG